MRFWVTSFIVLFGLAELYQWASHIALPLPLLVLGGVGLAIASNYDKRAGLPFLIADSSDEDDLFDDDDEEDYEEFEDEDEDPIDLPRWSKSSPPQQSVSFTIPKPPRPQ